MQPRSRKLPAADRRRAILEASAPMFARLGRAGTTTRHIASAAGVSEALLYRHFPSKDALYAELESHCVQAGVVADHVLEDATPSTATLVMGVAVLVCAVFTGIGDPQSHDDTKRLVTSSLLDDGRFARVFLDRRVAPWIDTFADALKAARAAGDVDDDAPSDRAELWFVHHLSHTLHLIALPGGTVIDYGLDRETLADRTVRFLLRGLGLTKAAIDRHYDPAKLEAVIAQSGREGNMT